MNKKEEELKREEKKKYTLSHEWTKRRREKCCRVSLFTFAKVNEFTLAKLFKPLDLEKTNELKTFAQFMAPACLHSHSCTQFHICWFIPSQFYSNAYFKQDMFRWIFDHPQLQKSYKEVSKIYNEANYSNNKSK